ncbi:unnamed protein product [Spirodela intermedia]|uniref:Uncharacterized protein n=1 Tax=Spirodela intermedia TaxID=51605 RepID=A0A7I8IBI6_SPIIN|nr:unnamed protein product [Spirodela intermedia]CAA6654948.1 unnamed protein product [Spirodela intermedia]
MENQHPSTLLSMDPTGAPSMASSHDESDREMMLQQRQQMGTLSRPPDINLPSPPSAPLRRRRGTPIPLYETESLLSIPKAGARKCARRGDSIWGAWFFFNFYFKPVLSEKAKGKVTRDAGGVSGFDKSDLRLDTFLVQHDMENMYMWMQLRSYMNGHSRLGEPQFPFSAEKGFVRSHRMQRKQYRGLSNPQCLHGIEVVRQPNLSMVSEADRKKWLDLTARDINFSIPPEASDFESPPPPPPLKNASHSHHQRRLLNGSGLNLSTQPSNHVGAEQMDLSPVCNKRRKDFFPQGIDEDCNLPVNSYSDRVAQDAEIHPAEPSWLNEFSGVMRHVYGPVTAAKTLYEDEEGYLIMVSLPFSDLQRVKVSWKNTPTHGVVKILCVSTARMPYIKRHDRTFKLTDPSPEHCPPGEFIREIPLPTRIPEDAKLEAYYDETGAVLEITVPKHRLEPEEHEVRVCLRPPLELMNSC